MTDAKGRWHGLHVDDDGTIDIYHPHTCPWSVTFMPRLVDTGGNEVQPSMTVRSHECDVGYELSENGNDLGLFPIEPGFYWVRLNHITHPSGPWGPTEYDVESEWVVVERPRLDIEPMEVS